MSHIESVRPSFCASRGRAGYSPSIIFFEIMTGVVNSLNGRLPVNTLGSDQISGKQFILPPPTLGEAGDDR